MHRESIPLRGMLRLPLSPVLHSLGQRGSKGSAARDHRRSSQCAAVAISGARAARKPNRRCAASTARSIPALVRYSLRLDADVVGRFKRHATSNEGYQTRILGSNLADYRRQRAKLSQPPLNPKMLAPAPQGVALSSRLRFESQDPSYRQSRQRHRTSWRHRSPPRSDRMICRSQTG